MWKSARAKLFEKRRKVNKMPRKPCDSTQEFRITLGDFERKKINEILKTQQANVAVDGVTAALGAAGTAIGGLGWIGVAAAALIWVDFDVDEFIDNTSSRIKTFLQGTAFVNYQADEYGRELQKVYLELSTLNDQLVALGPATPSTLSTHKKLMKRVLLLEKRKDVLEAIINAIAEGEESGYSVGYPSRHQMSLNETYSQWYVATHGESPPEEIDWDLFGGYANEEEYSASQSS